MADNYLQFSFLVTDLNEADVIILQTLWDLQCEVDNDQLPAGYEDHFTPEELTEFWGTVGAEEGDLTGVEMTPQTIDDDGTDDGSEATNAFWIRADTYGDPGAVVEFLQTWLTKTGDTRAISFTWAETCSKLRVDEFSGGGVVFTKDDCTWFGPNQQIREWLEKRASTKSEPAFPWDTDEARAAREAAEKGDTE